MKMSESEANLISEALLFFINEKENLSYDKLREASDLKVKLERWYVNESC